MNLVVFNREKVVSDLGLQGRLWWTTTHTQLNPAQTHPWEYVHHSSPPFSIFFFLWPHLQYMEVPNNQSLQCASFQYVQILGCSLAYVLSLTFAYLQLC